MNVVSSSQIQYVLRATSVWRQKTRRDVTAFILIGSIVLFLFVQCIICTFTKGKIPIFKPSMHFIHCKLVAKIIRKRPDINSVLRLILDKP